MQLKSVVDREQDAPEGLRTTGVYTVTDTFSHLDPVIVELTLGGETIETTPEHPFYVLLRGWVDAGDLRPGMAVRQADSEYGVVEQVELVPRSQRMYNLTVAEAHTFFVGDEAWLVHNANCDFEVYFRAVGEKELRAIEKTNWLELPAKRTLTGAPKGEKFVSPDVEYVASLMRRHPDKYKYLLQVRVNAGTLEALQQLNAAVQRGAPPAFFKMERGALNIGLRPDGLELFNRNILRIELLE